MGTIHEFGTVQNPRDRMFLRTAALPKYTSWTLEDDVNRTYCAQGLSATPMLVATDRRGHLCVMNFVNSMNGQPLQPLQETVLAAAVVQAAFSKPNWTVQTVWARVMFTEERRCLDVLAPLVEFADQLQEALAAMRARGLKTATVTQALNLLQRQGKLPTITGAHAAACAQ